MDNDISKINHYRSYYEVAKKLKDPMERLALYDAIDAYAFDGIEPENLPFVVDLVFTQIRVHIDADLGRKRGGAPIGNQNAKKQPENNLKTTSGTTKNNLENNPKTTVVSEKTNNDNVNVNDNVNENEDEDGNVKGESAEIGEEQPPSPPPPSKMSDSQENYSRIVFDKFKNAGLPCQKGDFFRFQSCDFRLALQKLKGIPSQDVISAVDNYIAELKKADSYIDKEFSFDTFVASKTFSNCLPANYRPNNFKKFAKDVPKKNETEQPRAFKCDVCGQIAATWSEKLMKWHCTACGADFD